MSTGPQSRETAPTPARGGRLPQIEEEYQRAFDKKRTVTKEEKQIQSRKEDADKYKDLLEEQVRVRRLLSCSRKAERRSRGRAQGSIQQAYNLFQLYHLEKDLSHRLREMANAKEVGGSRRSEALIGASAWSGPGGEAESTDGR